LAAYGGDERLVFEGHTSLGRCALCVPLRMSSVVVHRIPLGGAPAGRETPTAL